MSSYLYRVLSWAQTVDENQNLDEAMKILEESLVFCKFGKFHIKLLVASMCAMFATMMITTTSSYILPVAECDLNMNIMQKGLLNAMPFFGQIGASLFTGFLIDAFGRKIFLIGGNVAIFLCCIIEGSSQTYWMLLFTKLLQGISLSFSYSAIMTNLSEFSHKNIRDRILMTCSGFLAGSLIVAALVAWAILPFQIDMLIFEGYFQLHVWNIYLYVCSIWSFISIILFYYLPESPKYLLSHGQENEALEVIRTVYHENTGKPKNTLPTTSFNISYNTESISRIGVEKQIINALNEVKGLLRKPVLGHLLLFSTISFSGLISYTSLRLWLPQISVIVENYERNNGETAQFCTMMDSYMQKLRENEKNDTISQVCIPKIADNEPYINGIVLGLFQLLLIALSGCLVKYVSQKVLMIILLIMCSIASGAMFWTRTSIQIAILVSCTCAFNQAMYGLKQNIYVRCFPTTIRALAISIIMTSGRIGSLIGSIIFPILLELGCMAPFLTNTILSLLMAGLVYFLPNITKKNKEEGDS